MMMQSLFHTLNHLDEEQVRLVFLEGLFYILLRDIFSEVSIECETSCVATVLHRHKDPVIHGISLLIKR